MTHKRKVLYVGPIVVALVILNLPWFVWRVVRS